MSTHTSPLAGQLAPKSVLIDVDKLVAAYFSEQPDPTVAAQRVAFGTSGHRGSAFDVSFNEWHVLAITQAICNHRKGQGITGPLFMGIDTHALSVPACVSALEVLAANGVDVVLAAGNAFTPTPAISHAIVKHNRSGEGTWADGIVVTPSHNPPQDGGFKYNPPHGGPAGQEVTEAIQAAANGFLDNAMKGVRRVPHAQALKAATTHQHDFLGNYVEDLDHVIDMAAIRDAKVRIGVDPLGGAGVHYWAAIAERWKIDLTVVRETVDPRFAFMTLDWDGQIRMDPSSIYPMQPLIAIKDRFDIAVACDTDHDRHGIVTPAAGLLPPNHFLAVAIDYLFNHRPLWGADAAVGKTVVSTQLIDRVVARLKHQLYEVPVGFKWFSQGLLDGSLGFAGEESAGAAFLRRDGTAWTTDKDGLIAGLLAAEITARCGRDPGTLYLELASDFGSPVAERIDAPATPQQKQHLAALSPQAMVSTELAGEPVISVLSHAPGNGAPIGGIKVMSKSGWYAARPSGTEDIVKIYAESFQGPAHLQRLLVAAQATVDAALTFSDKATP
ncbi:phosphoglucomutase (alpha-D-glucose-1,6-bisphosphate-dependent) [Hydrogenophaga sp. PAMC20947]|uniref:phosphoglucomutase (alpha-D-glucose-1,6-bisphosphate-dependent) n=1 Tax=Hydrogenophaga sp. PAMC20947 TaxID=2565558 RepID=UPI00109D9F2E|nr:phosphoglucomutase (alpha-D-glucose-1,6-bisphosphate-dependent) [Hydrogenophaga sp. PAMC20947]QCB45410.1 alpha-D-glucose phosphate-specific phosphoglucomutase [Hydrogenophaga sp. PAMC20947]